MPARFWLTLLLVLSACGSSVGTDLDAATTSTSGTPAEAPADVGPPRTAPGSTTEEPPEPNASVERVVDGDTIVVDVDGQRERVRLIGIDTPESVAENRPDQCFGAESASYLSSLLPPGTPVTLIRDVEARDRFDRLLAYVVRSSDGLFVNLDLVTNGYAGPFTFPPNVFYADVLESAAAEAAAAGLGLWGTCGGPDVPIG